MILIVRESEWKAHSDRIGDFDRIESEWEALQTGKAILIVRESEWKVLSDRKSDFDSEGVRMEGSFRQEKRF